MIQRARISQKMRMHELFASVDPAVLESALDGEIKTAVLQRGDIIADENTLSNAVVFILSGSAIRRKTNNELCFERLLAGRLYGLETLLTGDRSSATVLMATRETQVLYLSKTAVFRLLKEDPSFSLNVIRFLSAHVCALERRVTTYTGGSAESRLARFLIDAFGDENTFELDRSMQQLATILDISRPSLYRAFSGLQECGAIEREGKSIRLLSREALMQYNSSDQ